MASSPEFESQLNLTKCLIWSKLLNFSEAAFPPHPPSLLKNDFIF